LQFQHHPNYHDDSRAEHDRCRYSFHQWAGVDHDDDGQQPDIYDSGDGSWPLWDMVRAVLRCGRRHVQPVLDASGIEADRHDQDLGTADHLRHPRDNSGQQYPLRHPRRGRNHVHRIHLRQLDVGKLRGPKRQRQLERHEVHLNRSQLTSTDTGTDAIPLATTTSLLAPVLTPAGTVKLTDDALPGATDIEVIFAVRAYETAPEEVLVIRTSG
jgi:hypothetical protein